jgi:DNA-directed RNA polymerase subunit F
MIGEKIIERKNICLAEIEKLLSERKKEKELTYEQETSLKYAKNFSKISVKEAQKIYEELMKLDGMTDRLAVKIIDIMPKHIEIMKNLPLKEEEVKEETLMQAFEIIKKYLK